MLDCKCFVRAVLLAALFLSVHVAYRCFVYQPTDLRGPNTGMLILSKRVLMDPDSLEVVYEDGELRHSSILIVNIDEDNLTKSFSKMYFLEEKGPADVFYSVDGANYEPVPFDQRENISNKAYH